MAVVVLLHHGTNHLLKMPPRAKLAPNLYKTNQRSKTMSDLNREQETVFACDMNALTPDQREHHGSASRELFADVSEVRETPNGYAFRLPKESSTLVRV